MAPPTPTSIMLVTGEYFDPYDPDPAVINLDVLEHGLQAPRFNNQTTRPISIAEHSMRVRRIAAELARADDSVLEQQAQAGYEAARATPSIVVALTSWAALPPMARENWRLRVMVETIVPVELWALLHDAHEALTPWGDCLRPGKTDKMREVEHQVDVAIIEALGMQVVTLPTQETVWIADEIALYFEAMLWQPGAADWAAMPVEHIEHRYELLEVRRLLPMIAPRPGESWRTEVEDLLGKQVLFGRR